VLLWLTEHWLGADWEGGGIITAAVQALVACVFSTTPATQQQIRTAVHSTASRRVTQKGGVKYVGKKEKGGVPVWHLDRPCQVLLDQGWATQSESNGI
jgi:RimJ/RimL family protein N-acetyltransferase